MTHHFYIHIPFCRQKCPYCKFALTPIVDAFKKKRYIEHLKKEIGEYFSVPISICEFGKSIQEEGVKAMNSGDLGRETVGVGGKKGIGGAEQTSFSLPNSFGTFSTKSTSKIVVENKSETPISLSPSDIPISQLGLHTIYFGGGTPSILSITEIREILEYFPFYRKTEIEITIEANPEDINQAYIAGLLALGINRISLGIQTLNEKSLTEIHRSNQESIFGALHSIESIIGKSTSRISINTDFILGLPYVQPGETREGIQKLHQAFPFITHTSVYMLEDELYPKHWKTHSISEGYLQKEFIEIMEYLKSIGWNHYELSNWAKPEYESVHNRAYWNHSNSRGFGLSGANYEDRERWSNSESFHGYYQGKIENKEILTQGQIEIENMMFGLRTNGWNIVSQKIASESKIQKLISEGLLQIHSNTIKPTKTGIFVLDHIMSELLS